jgi:hypothetical protein
MLWPILLVIRLLFKHGMSSIKLLFNKRNVFFSIKHIFLGIETKDVAMDMKKLVDATLKPYMFQ